MLPGNWKELLGLDDLGLKDYEVVKKLKEARAKKLDEIEFILGNGKTVKIRLKHLNYEDLIGENVWGW